MKRLLLSLLLGVFLCSPVFAAGPKVEQGNMIRFDTAAQTTTASYRIRAIAWVSVDGAEIGINDDFTLSDGAGTVILMGEATALTDSLVVSIPGEGIVVSGLTATALTSGNIFLYVTKR